MSEIKGVLRNHLLERPFDFYVAFLLFLVGVYSIVSDHWPEGIDNGLVRMLIMIISFYYILASVIVMISLSCRRRRCPVLSLMGEMYGWLFISAASFASVLMYIGSVFGGAPQSWAAWGILLIVWFGLFIASGLRFLDLFNVYRSIKR